MTDELILWILLNTAFTAVFLFYPAWRICKKAGLSPIISIILMLPFVGGIFCLALLAFAPWATQVTDELEVER